MKEANTEHMHTVKYAVMDTLPMRVIVRAIIPTEAGNKMVKEPNFLANMENYIKANNVEAAYFMETGGERTTTFVMDMASADRMPAIAEPLFALGAKVEVHPAMTLDDLKKGIQNIPK
jgi:hypothetical protein